MSKQTIRLSIAERKLKSGLTLLAVHNPGVQTYACVASLDVRMADEDPRWPGVANMVGECLDEGTPSLSSPSPSLSPLVCSC